MVEKFIVYKMPHPKSYVKALKNPFSGQLMKSYYVIFFQIPYLPDIRLYEKFIVQLGTEAQKHAFRNRGKTYFCIPTYALKG